MIFYLQKTKNNLQKTKIVQKLFSCFKKYAIINLVRNYDKIIS